MKTMHIEFSDERLITPSGLAFVGQILGKSNFVKKINRAPISNEYLQKQIKNGDILLTYIGMLCQGKPQDFLRETIEPCRQLTDKPLLIRLDSGNDASENIGIFMEESYKHNNVSFIIKRNPRRESKEEWLASVKDCCTNIRKPRDGKAIYTGQTFRDVACTLPDKTEKTAGIRTIYEITERTIDKHGRYFIVPDIELGTYWTNPPLPDQNIIDLYHAHGESEQCHSEIKTDMDVERLPSGKFDSNKLVLELTVIAYNILRIAGRESLKKRDDPKRKKVRRRRIRIVICTVVCLLTPNIYDFQGTMPKRSYQRRQNNAPHIFEVMFTDSGIHLKFR